MLQVEYDWAERDTPAGLVGSAFKFKGPGFYLSDTDTLLIVESEKGQYWLYCRFEETIFCEVATMTLQSDERKIKSCEKAFKLPTTYKLIKPEVGTI